MHKVTLTTGMQRNGTTSTSRTFFVYVAPTSAELPLKECPAIKRSWSRGGYAKPDQAMERVEEFEVREPVQIKMIAIYTSFGKKKEFGNLYLDLDENFELIELTGLNSFGGFRGRARIDRKKSNVSDEQLKESFHLAVLGPPLGKAPKGNTRSLVI